MLFCQLQQAHAGFIGLFLNGVSRKHPVHDAKGFCADLAGPLPISRSIPLIAVPLRPVVLRHVRRIADVPFAASSAGMGSDAVPVSTEYFDAGGCRP